MGKRLISFSLYGTASRYLDAAKPIVEDIHRFFSGYIPRFYVSEEIEEGLTTQLKDMGAEIVHKERKYHSDGMFWRFLAAGDPEAEIVLIRDVDTRFGLRDKQANDAWLASGKDYHIIRDEVRHGEKIMGGLLSVGKQLPYIAQWIDEWKFQDCFFGDQYFLAMKVYPYIRDRSFIQTSCCVFLGEKVHSVPPLVYTGDEKVVCMGLPPPESVEQIERAIKCQIQARNDKYIYPVPWNIMLVFKMISYPLRLFSLRWHLAIERSLKFSFLGKPMQLLDKWIPDWMNTLVLSTWHKMKRIVG